MRWSIRAKLTLLVLAVLTPLVAGAALEFWREMLQERERAQQSMRSAADGIARQLDEILIGQIQNLVAIAGARTLEGVTDEDLAILAARVQVDHPFVHRLLTAGLSGWVTAASDPPIAEPGSSSVRQGLLDAVLRSREPRIGPPQPSAIDQRLVVPLVAPILDRKGAVQGVVVAEFDQEALSAFLERVPLDAGARVTIVTTDSAVVARSGASSTSGRSSPLSGTEAPEVGALIEQRGGVAQWRQEDGRQHLLAGAAALSQAPWVVVATIPSKVAYGPAAARFRGNLLTLSLVTGLALMLAWLISRRMSRSVRALSEGARSLAAGHGPAISVQTTDELAELAQQFNRAVNERQAAHAALDARRRRLQALADMTLSLSQQLELEPLLHQITATLAQLTSANNVVLWAVDQQVERLVRRAFTAAPSVTSVELPLSLTFDEGGTGWVARNRKPLFIEDITGDERMLALSWARSQDLLAFAAVPVLAGEELLGVLTLNLKRGRILDAEDRALLLSFASQAAVAIRNARLFAEAEARRRTAETFADLSRALAQALDPDVVAQRIADSVRLLFGAQSSGLYRLAPESDDLVGLAVSGDVGPMLGTDVVFPRGTGLVGVAVRERKPVATANLLADTRVTFTPEARRRLEHALYRAVLAVPLVVKDTVIGALGVGDREGRVFGAEDIRLAQAFADQAALALENARLYAEATRRRREAEELARLARTFTESLDVAEVGRRIVESVRSLFAAKSSSLRLLRPNGELEMIALGGRAQHYYQAGDILSPAIGVVGQALAEGKTAWSADVFREPGLTMSDDLRSRVERSGDRAILAAPLIVKGTVIGVLTVSDDEGRRFPEGEIALLATFADQAALALENARLYAEATQRRREAEELARLARTFTESLDVAHVGRRIVESILPLFGVSSSRLGVRQPDGSLQVIASGGRARDFFEPGYVIPARVGIVGQAMARGKPVWSSDVFAEPGLSLPDDVREYVERTGDNAVLAVPLTVKGETIGALVLNDHAGRSFSEADIGLLQAFADQAALALENARLHEQTRLRLRHLDSLREVVEQILVPFSLEDRLNLVARKAAELFDADRVVVALWDEGRRELVIRAGYALGEGELGLAVEMGRGALGAAAARREGVLVNDYPAWPDRRREAIEGQQSHPLQAVISCPLLIRDQVIGALAVGVHTAGRGFAPTDLDRLASLAAPAALAIEHSRLYEELEARLRQLQDTQTQLVQAGKMSALGQLVSGVAHELNNPLSVVIGHGQLLLARELPAVIRRPVELIVSQGARMAKIVQGLLLFARQRKPERSAVDVREVIDQTIALRAAQLRLSGIQVETDHASELPSAEGDAQQLQQVFLNLLLNAEQAILGPRVGDRIRIQTAARSKAGTTWVVVRVSDNGPGIPEDVLTRIFDPFFTTKSVGEGTGLGLSVSYGIIQQHGGRLIVESRPGHTVFTVELPSTTEPSAVIFPPGERRPHSAGQGRRALVVDDEPSVADFVTTLLREEGWHVDVSLGGRAALQRLSDSRYDLIVADIRMSDGGGEELYRSVIVKRRDLAERFLFMTGDTANPAAWKFLEETRVPVLEKPFSADALLRAVERLTALTA